MRINSAGIKADIHGWIPKILCSIFPLTEKYIVHKFLYLQTEIPYSVHDAQTHGDGEALVASGQRAALFRPTGRKQIHPIQIII